jgi:Lar family restriction alleviation protein
MSNDLKSCPFCGGKAEHSIGKTGDGKPWHYVECVDCGATGPTPDYADHNIAVIECRAEAWNTRADRIKELEAKLARSVDALDWIGNHMVMSMALDQGDLCMMMKQHARATLAELKGEKP